MGVHPGMSNRNQSLQLNSLFKYISVAEPGAAPVIAFTPGPGLPLLFMSAQSIHSDAMYKTKIFSQI